jgi:hypothetical protein
MKAKAESSKSKVNNGVVAELSGLRRERWVDERFLPLTPALSLGERGKRLAAQLRTRISNSLSAVEKVSLSLGRGEG